VEDIVDANKNAVVKDIFMAGRVLSNTHHDKIPLKKAIKNTPAVAKTAPCRAMGRISSILVSKPPEKRMMERAIVPIDWAA